MFYQILADFLQALKFKQMKKIKKFRKNKEDFGEVKRAPISRKKRLTPDDAGKKKLLKHYFEEE